MCCTSYKLGCEADKLNEKKQGLSLFDVGLGEMGSTTLSAYSSVGFYTQKA